MAGYFWNFPTFRVTDFHYQLASMTMASHLSGQPLAQICGPTVAIGNSGMLSHYLVKMFSRKVGNHFILDRKL